jgi:hypothetical protein
MGQSCQDRNATNSQMRLTVSADRALPDTAKWFKLDWQYATSKNHGINSCWK